MIGLQANYAISCYFMRKALDLEVQAHLRCRSWPSDAIFCAGLLTRETFSAPSISLPRPLPLLPLSRLTDFGSLERRRHHHRRRRGRRQRRRLAGVFKEREGRRERKGHHLLAPGGRARTPAPSLVRACRPVSFVPREGERGGRPAIHIKIRKLWSFEKVFKTQWKST